MKARWWIVAAVVLGLAVSCDGFREDEFECERAAAHLRDCCPGFEPSVSMGPDAHGVVPPVKRERAAPGYRVSRAFQSEKFIRHELGNFHERLGVLGTFHHLPYL